MPPDNHLQLKLTCATAEQLALQTIGVVAIYFTDLQCLFLNDERDNIT